MDAGKCSRCNSDNEWLEDFKEDVTQTVEVMGEDEYEYEDRTYPIWFSVSKCTNPECGYMFLYDRMGGLGEIKEADYERRLAASQKRF